MSKLSWKRAGGGFYWGLHGSIDYLIEPIGKDFHLYTKLARDEKYTHIAKWDSLAKAKRDAQSIENNIDDTPRKNPIGKWEQLTPRNWSKRGANSDSFHIVKIGNDGGEWFKVSHYINGKTVSLGVKHTLKEAKLATVKKANPIKHPNPRALKTAHAVDRAKALRAGFRATAGGAAGQTGKVKQIKQAKPARVQMAIGIVDCIEYTVVDDKGRRIPGQSFRHEFTGKSCPTLTTSHDGKQLYLVGGSYRFKTDGINDIK